MSLNDTPRSERLHIGLFGKTNSGKSSLINALTGQDIAIVSDVAGTTADPVYKSMEIHGIGPVVFIDTAGFDDSSILGEMRVHKTAEALQKTDIALVIFTDTDIDQELDWIEKLKAQKTPVIPVINKIDLLGKKAEDIAEKIQSACHLRPVAVSALDRSGIAAIREAIMRRLPEDYDVPSLTSPIVKENALVLLVMPQDIQAPKGRLILPQVQTIRDLLDKHCVVVSVTTDGIDRALESLGRAPDVIITDSQVFKTVYDKKPAKSLLTSFSVLMAAYKGDIDYFTESVRAIESLTENSKVLIAEACTHAPLAEDIGREKIPRFLRQKVGHGLTVDIVSGQDFPEDLSGYDLIIHCGGCMFNRKYMLSRANQAKAQHVPMTNYGVTIAYLSGILDKISF